MQLARLRQVRPGQWATVWSRLLDEIKEAKRCLTDPQSKAVYDAAIAARVAALTANATFPQAVAGGSVPVALAPMPPMNAAAEANGGLGVRVPFPVGYTQPATTVPVGGAADPPPPLPKAVAVPAWPNMGTTSMPMAAVAEVAPGWPAGPLSGGAAVATDPLLPLPAQQAAETAAVPLPSLPVAAPVGGGLPQPVLPSADIPPSPAAIASPAKQPTATPSQTTGFLGALLRWGVVGVLLIVLGVLSVMLHNKLQDEADRLDSDGKKSELARSDNGPNGNGGVAKRPSPTGPNQRPSNGNGSPPAVAPGSAKGSSESPPRTLPVSTSNDDPAGSKVTPGTGNPNGSKPNRPDDPNPLSPSGNGGRPTNPPQASDDPDKRAAFRKSLSEARIAMAEREYADAKKALAAAARLAQTADERKELQRLEQLEAHLDGFWKSIRDVMPKLDGTEMPIGNTFISIVEADDQHVLVKAAGQMRRYGVGTPDMPIKLITAIAEQRFKPDSTWNALYGTFHAMDRDGDRGKARQLWGQAGKLGADLLSELDVPRQSAISSPNGSGSSAGGTRPSAEPPPATTDFGAAISEIQQQAEAAKAIAQHSEVARKALAECQRACAAKRWDDALKLAQIAQGAARESKSPALLRQAYAAVQQIEAVRKER